MGCVLPPGPWFTLLVEEELQFRSEISWARTGSQEAQWLSESRRRGALVGGLSWRAEVRLRPRRGAGDEAISQSCDSGHVISVSGGRFARVREASCSTSSVRYNRKRGRLANRRPGTPKEGISRCQASQEGCLRKTPSLCKESQKCRCSRETA